jgi:chromosomal replication initiator protein
MVELKEKYRNLDLLLLDDVQFIAKKTATQEEFFYTFNALYEKQKQIVISCDRPPKEISEVTDRLRSRFNMGLIADIQPPDIETKLAIIYKKADMMALKKIPEDVANFLAAKIRSNIRELEGCLIRIAAQASLTGEEINLETTKKILKDIIQDDERPVTVEAVQKIVCDFYNISLADIKAKRRTKDIALPRQVAMYLSKQVTEASLSDIGKHFGGKDHATVIYACKQIEERRVKDETFNRMMENLLQKIKN